MVLITENLSTLKINKMTQAQYERELEAGRIDPNGLYLTPDEGVDMSGYATVDHKHTTTNGGSAHGDGATATYGGAMGKNSNAARGGAIGYGAKATDGFSGGWAAKAEVDAIQLGSGTNTEGKSLQVYDTKLMNGSGMIPFARYAKFVKGTTAYNLTSGTVANEHIVHSETNTPSENPGTIIVMPVMRCSFNLVATVRYSRGSTMVQVTRPVGMAENSAITGYYLDYWIFSEKPI